MATSVCGHQMSGGGGGRHHGHQTMASQWLYTVVFDGAELWGPDGDPTVTISIDAFEPYLEAA